MSGNEQIVKALIKEYALSTEEASNLKEKYGLSREKSWEKLDERTGKIDAADW